MNQFHHIITHENSNSVINLPDSWPGRTNGSVHILKEDEQTQGSWGLCGKRFIRPEHAILLFSENNYVTNGIRFSVEDIPGIRLRISRTYEDITKQINAFSPDVVIFAPSTLNDTRRVMTAILMMYEVKPSTNVIVIESVSGTLCRLSGIWKNFRCISDVVTPSELKEKVVNEINNTKCQMPFVQSLLTSQQWKTIRLLSKGLNVSCAASNLCISVKTASLHKNKAMKRLGIDNKLHEAWFLNAISKLC